MHSLQADKRKRILFPISCSSGRLTAQFLKIFLIAFPDVIFLCANGHRNETNMLYLYIRIPISQTQTHQIYLLFITIIIIIIEYMNILIRAIYLKSDTIEIKLNTCFKYRVKCLLDLCMCEFYALCSNYLSFWFKMLARAFEELLPTSSNNQFI